MRTECSNTARSRRYYPYSSTVTNSQKKFSEKEIFTFTFPTCNREPCSIANVCKLPVGQHTVIHARILDCNLWDGRPTNTVKNDIVYIIWVNHFDSVSDMEDHGLPWVQLQPVHVRTTGEELCYVTLQPCRAPKGHLHIWGLGHDERLACCKQTVEAI